MSSVSESAVERRVRAWLDSFVVGLNLCPFARPVVASESLRISICDANQLQTVAQRFLTEFEKFQNQRIRISQHIKNQSKIFPQTKSLNIIVDREKGSTFGGKWNLGIRKLPPPPHFISLWTLLSLGFAKTYIL